MNPVYLISADDAMYMIHDAYKAMTAKLAS